MLRLILASSSPRRRHLLDEAGYIYDAVSPNVDESHRNGETAYAYALRIAQEKALEVVAEGAVTLGADTVVVYAGQALGKPRDAADAAQVLELLSGEPHQVMTGWALADSDGIIVSGVEVTGVSFRELSRDQIEDYVDSGEPLDRAGSYAIQGGAAGFVAGIDGSYSNVMGLPIETLAIALAEVGVLPEPIDDSAT